MLQPNTVDKLKKEMRIVCIYYYDTYVQKARWKPIKVKWKQDLS